MGSYGAGWGESSWEGLELPPTAPLEHETPVLLAAHIRSILLQSILARRGVRESVRDLEGADLRAAPRIWTVDADPQSAAARNFEGAAAEPEVGAGAGAEGVGAESRAAAAVAGGGRRANLLAARRAGNVGSPASVGGREGGGGAVGAGGLLSPELEACRNGDVPAVLALLEEGWSVHTADRFGGPALHWAASSGSLPLCQLLVARSADVAKSDKKSGRSAVHWAARHGHVEVLFKNDDRDH
ncbi:hypothetical protein T492DRAFT_320364 [Pavlovales sp. CCMP2436]|nr:hypothetical protein T492DRAFT_320364 [Pavlovales sp. CCMP2436]